MKMFIVLLMFAVCAAQEESKLPTDVQKVLASYQEDVDKLNLKRDQEVAKLSEKLVASLEKAQASATKKGDLEGALAIKAELDEVNKALADLVLGITPRKAAWVDKKTWQIVWSGSRNFVEFNSDGTMLRADGAKGTFTVAEDGALSMTWDDGLTWTAVVPPKSTPDTTAGRNHNGTSFVMQRERDMEKR